MGAGTDETGNVSPELNNVTDDSPMEERPRRFVEPPPPMPGNQRLDHAAAGGHGTHVGVYDSGAAPARPAHHAGSPNDDVNTAESQIEETRSELSKTIGALKEKLNPSQFIKQAKDTVGITVKERAEQRINAARDTIKSVASQAVDSAKGLLNRGSNTQEGSAESSGGRVKKIAESAKRTTKGIGSTAMSTIKQNTVPLAVTLTGLLWLILRMRSQRSNANTDEVMPVNTSPTADMPSASGNGMGEMVQNKAEAAKSGMSRMVDERPFLAGGIAMVLGMFTGFIVPETQRENELMGETRDRLAGQAEHTVKETISSKVDQAAKTVVDKVESVTHEMLGTSA